MASFTLYGPTVGPIQSVRRSAYGSGAPSFISHVSKGPWNLGSRPRVQSSHLPQLWLPAAGPKPTYWSLRPQFAHEAGALTVSSIVSHIRLLHATRAAASQPLRRVRIHNATTSSSPYIWLIQCWDHILASPYPPPGSLVVRVVSRRSTRRDRSHESNCRPHKRTA